MDGTGRTYDAAGNTTAIVTAAKSFVYADTGRMTELRNNGTQLKQYLYNARGERVRKYHGSIMAENQYTVYDESGHVLGDYDNALARVREMVWMDNLPVAAFDAAGAVAYIEPDQLGTPRVAIDANPAHNVAIWKWPLLNDPFGESAPQQDPDGDSIPFVLNLRMPGQVWDAESGVSYNYQRDYEAGTGRYIESDPIGLWGGISTYGYVGENPILGFDSLGLLDAYGRPFVTQSNGQAAVQVEFYGYWSGLGRDINNGASNLVSPIFLEEHRGLDHNLVNTFWANQRVSVICLNGLIVRFVIWLMRKR